MGAPSAYCAPAYTPADLEPGGAAVAGRDHGGAQGGERGGRRAARRHGARERVLSALRRVACSPCAAWCRASRRRAGAAQGLCPSRRRAMRPLVARRGSSAAQGTAAGGTSTADCLWLRDVGGGEIDQPTKLAGHHRAEGQPRRHSAVSAHADTCARAHRDDTERLHTTHTPVHEALS